MASGLGRMPLNIQQGNYGDAALSVLAPVTAGAFAGIGAQNTRQFLNNAFNPLAGVGDLLKSGYNKIKNVGVPSQLPGSSNVNNDVLQFVENPNSYYRMIGETGYDDLIKEGYIRTNPSTRPAEWEVASRYEPNKAWFNKGFPLNTKYNELGKPLNVGYKGPYMVEVSDIDMITEAGKLNRTYGYPKEKLTLNNPNLKIWKEDGKGGFTPVNKQNGGEINQYPNGGGIWDSLKEEFQTDVIAPLKKLFTTESKLKYTDIKSLPKYFNLQDNRKINPITKKPLNPNKDLKNFKNVNKEDIQAIIKMADYLEYPRDLALAVSLQESGLGKTDANLGHNLDYDFTPRMEGEVFSDAEKDAGAFITGLKDKAEYAKTLYKQKKIPKNDLIYQLQAYNGFGTLTPNTEANYYQTPNQKFYGVDVVGKPLSMKQNPLYGKTIINYRDSIINQDPTLKKFLNLPKYYYEGGEVEIPIMKNGGQHGGLDRWFAEKWIDVKTGKECGRQKGEKRKSYPACRPSKRINSETPKTASELSASEKAKFKREKTSSERIDYNHKKEDGGLIYNDMKKKLKKYPAGGYLNYQEGYKGFGIGPQLYQDNSYFRSVMPDNIENMEEQINKPSIFSGINDVLGSVNQGVNQITGLMSQLPQPSRQLTLDKLGGTEGVTTLQGMTKINENLVAPEYSAGMWGQKNPLFTAPQSKNGGYLNKYQDGGYSEMPLGNPEYIHKSNVFNQHIIPVPKVHFSDDTSVFDMGVNLNDLVQMYGGRVNKYANGGDMSLQGYFNYLQNQNPNRVPSNAFNSNTQRATAADLQAATANDFLHTKMNKDRQSFKDDQIDWGFMNWAKDPAAAGLGFLSTVPIVGDISKDLVGDSFLTRRDGYQFGKSYGKVTSGAAKIAGGIATGNVGMVGSGIGDVGSGVGEGIGNLGAKDSLAGYDKAGYISNKRLANASNDFGSMMDNASSLYGTISGGINQMKGLGGMKGIMGNMKGGETGMKGFGNVMGKLTGFGQNGGMVDYMYNDIENYAKGGLVIPKKVSTKNKKTTNGWLDTL